jgi:hypothetical protein
MLITTLLAIGLLILLWFVLRKKYLSISNRLARFWKYPTKKQFGKYPTIEDIRLKYPKRLSQDQLRKQARAKDDDEARRKQAIIERNIREAKAGRESKLETAQKLDLLHEGFRNKNSKQAPDTCQPIRKRDISIAKFRKLTKMVHGREDVASRLINGNLKLFPDKSPDWACEKAISDIERDRRI